MLLKAVVLHMKSVSSITGQSSRTWQGYLLASLGFELKSLVYLGLELLVYICIFLWFFFFLYFAVALSGF